MLDDILRAVDERRRAPVDGREWTSAARFLGEVPHLARPFDEHADPTHITASAMVVGERGVLLLRHKLLGIWLQPGGHVDEGEAPADAALRETIEETGLAVRHESMPPRIAHVDVHPGPKGHTHLDLRYVLLAEGDDDPSPPAHESQDVRWFDWDEAIAIADAGLRGALLALRP